MTLISSNGTNRMSSHKLYRDPADRVQLDDGELDSDGGIGPRVDVQIRELVPQNNERENFLQTDRNIFISMGDVMETLSGDLDSHLRVSVDDTQQNTPAQTVSATTGTSPWRGDTLPVSDIQHTPPYMQAPQPVSHTELTNVNRAYTEHRAPSIYSPAYSDQAQPSPPYQNPHFTNQQSPSNVIQNLAVTYLTEPTYGPMVSPLMSDMITPAVNSSSTQFMNTNVQNVPFEPLATLRPFQQYSLQTDGSFSAMIENTDALPKQLGNIGQKRPRQKTTVKLDQKQILDTYDSPLDIGQHLTSLNQSNSFDREKKIVCGEGQYRQSYGDTAQFIPPFFLPQNIPANFGQISQQQQQASSPMQLQGCGTAMFMPPASTVYPHLQQTQILHQLQQRHANIATATQPPVRRPEQPPAYSQTPDISNPAVVHRNGAALRRSNLDTDDCIVVSSYPAPQSAAVNSRTVKRESDIRGGGAFPDVVPASAPQNGTDCYERLAQVQDEDGGKLFHYLVEFYNDLVSEGRHDGAMKILHLTLIYLKHPALRRLINHRNNNWQTPLHLAVESNLSRMTTLFLCYRADVTAVAKRHTVTGTRLETALHVAVSHGDAAVKIVRHLLETTKVNVNTRNSDGETALHVACKVHGQLNRDGVKVICNHVIQLLMENMEKETEFNATESKSGRTALMLAVMTKDITFIEEFLAHIDNKLYHPVLNYHDNCNNTCMHYAGGLRGLDVEQHASIIWKLMTHGGEPDSVNKNKETARSFAEQAFSRAVSMMQGR